MDPVLEHMVSSFSRVPEEGPDPDTLSLSSDGDSSPPATVAPAAAAPAAAVTGEFRLATTAALCREAAVAPVCSRRFTAAMTRSFGACVADPDPDPEADLLSLGGNSDDEGAAGFEGPLGVGKVHAIDRGAGLTDANEGGDNDDEHDQDDADDAEFQPAHAGVLTAAAAGFGTATSKRFTAFMTQSFSRPQAADEASIPSLDADAAADADSKEAEFTVTNRTVLTRSNSRFKPAGGSRRFTAMMSKSFAKRPVGPSGPITACAAASPVADPEACISLDDDDDGDDGDDDVNTDLHGTQLPPTTPQRAPAQTAAAVQPSPAVSAAGTDASFYSCQGDMGVDVEPEADVGTAAETAVTAPLDEEDDEFVHATSVLLTTTAVNAVATGAKPAPAPRRFTAMMAQSFVSGSGCGGEPDDVGDDDFLLDGDATVPTVSSPALPTRELATEVTAAAVQQPTHPAAVATTGVVAPTTAEPSRRPPTRMRVSRAGLGGSRWGARKLPSDRRTKPLHNLTNAQ